MLTNTMQYYNLFFIKQRMGGVNTTE